MAVAEVIVDKAVRFVYVCTLEVVVEVFVKCAFGLCLMMSAKPGRVCAEAPIVAKATAKSVKIFFI